MVGRRRFIAGLGALTAAIAYPHSVQASEAAALVLSCIDFRFVRREQAFLEQLNLSDHYDWTALAGASLAIAGFPHLEDATAFWDQLDLAYSLHHVRRVLILDHQDCGAYALKLTRALVTDPDDERRIHAQYLQQAVQSIGNRYADIEVETYFARLDGEVERLT